MNLRDKIELKIRANTEENTAMNALLERLPETGVEIESNNLNISICGGTLDIDNPSRADAVSLMSALNAGKWNKEQCGQNATLNYISDSPIVAGMKVRLWGASPPQTCRVVEEDVLIAAVPEHVEKRKRLICSEVTEDAAVLAQDQKATLHPSSVMAEGGSTIETFTSHVLSGGVQ